MKKDMLEKEKEPEMRYYVTAMNVTGNNIVEETIAKFVNAINAIEFVDRCKEHIFPDCIWYVYYKNNDGILEEWYVS